MKNDENKRKGRETKDKIDSHDMRECMEWDETMRPKKGGILFLF